MKQEFKFIMNPTNWEFDNDQSTEYSAYELANGEYLVTFGIGENCGKEIIKFNRAEVEEALSNDEWLVLD